MFLLYFLLYFECLYSQLYSEYLRSISNSCQKKEKHMRLNCNIIVLYENKKGK